MIILSEAIKKYIIGTYVITFVYRQQKEGGVLRYISIRPLSPYDAEFLKTMIEIPLDWSFEKSSGTVKFWPQTISEKISSGIEKTVITQLFRIVPEIRRELSEKTLIEKLVEKGWLVSSQNKIIIGRKSLEVDGYEGYFEVILEKNEAWYVIHVKIKIIESDFNKYRRIRLRLQEILRGKIDDQYPFLTLEVELGEYIVPEILKKLDEIYDKVRGVVLG